MESYYFALVRGVVYSEVTAQWFNVDLYDGLCSR